MTKVRGFLKVSMSVLHQKDGRVELSTKNDVDNSMCVIPPQIKLEYKQLSIYISVATNIPDMDSILNVSKKKAECDGYVRVEYMGIKHETSVVKMKNRLIVWNEVILMGVVYPIISQKLLFSVWDKDRICDDIVGCFELKLSDILNGKYSDFKYINLYGPPLGYEDKIGKKMINNPEIGSLWRGGIMIMINSNDTDTPVKAVKPITDIDILRRCSNLNSIYDWRFDIFYHDIYYLPSDNEEYGLIIYCGDKKKGITPRVVIINLEMY